MLLSMTGYGAAQHEGDSLSLSVEVRAVNNRHLKINLRTSDPYYVLEQEIEKLTRKTIRRGTLQITLRCGRESAPSDFQLNTVALESYFSQLQPLIHKYKFGSGGESLLAQLLMLPGVVAEPVAGASPMEEEWPVIRKVIQVALDQLQLMRREEGQAMAQELLSLRQEIRSHLDHIQKAIPLVATTYRDRLYDRVRLMLAEHDIELDRSDLIKEVSVFSERSDIAEEVTRLLSHLDQFQEIIGEPESAGRKLDFLTQEMFRECNTIGAKAGSVEISRHVVEIKGILEKIRELVQNVE